MMTFTNDNDVMTFDGDDDVMFLKDVILLIMITLTFTDNNDVMRWRVTGMQILCFYKFEAAMPGICPASAVLASTPTISQWWESSSENWRKRSTSCLGRRIGLDVMMMTILIHNDDDEHVDNDDKNEKDDDINWDLRENVFNTILSCRLQNLHCR